jgi:FtsZ-binding cell division protein ZapB
MQIPLIIVLVAAETLLILLALSITLGIFLLRKPQPDKTVEEPVLESAESELDGFDLGNSYIDFLEQAMERNTLKTSQQQAIEADIEAETESTTEETDEEATEAPSPPPDETQSKLLQAREQFLALEKAAAEKTEHEIHFWDSIYTDMQALLDQYSSTETLTLAPGESTGTTNAVESKEKVFYIETQGKKIDGEVNKLKDIIFEQENALSSMKKAMQNAEDEHPEESESLKELKILIEAIEQQLNDSKMCMEVLEMENNRLQEEVDKMDARHDSLFEDNNDSEDENEGVIDLDQIKEVVEDQERKIAQLIDTIESLEIEASQAEKLKDTLKDFTRTSKEMMSCITILEEENEKLAKSNQSSSSSDADSDSASAEKIESLRSNISKLEEDIIKKDVAHAQLQDEFTSMETEYLAMYEAMHGDSS